MTQWPRYEVFKQDRPSKPYEAIGTVHAPDGEIALFHARNVHVRRPACHSLWVAPEESILKLTAQQITDEFTDLEENGKIETYEIFCKRDKRRSMVAVTHVGSVDATNAQAALQQVIDETPAAYVWWAVPQAAITRSDDESIESWFAPAHDKTYRHQSAYGKI